MAIKLVRIKKKKGSKAASAKMSEVDKFIAAIELQKRIAGGEQVKQGKGFARSWIEDGESFGEKKVLRPRIGNVLLWEKAAMPVKSADGLAELNVLLDKAKSDRLNSRIYSILRAARKKAALSGEGS